MYVCLASFCEVGYVFAWTNLFTRSLWGLTAVCMLFWICGARPQMGGYEGVLPSTYLLQHASYHGTWEVLRAVLRLQVVHLAVSDSVLGNLLERSCSVAG